MTRLDSVGARILSRITGADGQLGAYTWPDWGDPGPDSDQTARLRVAYLVWKMLQHHGDDFVGHWVLTVNPVVGRRPADAMAADDMVRVLQAAQLVRDADALDESGDEEDEEW